MINLNYFRVLRKCFYVDLELDYFTNISPIDAASYFLEFEKETVKHPPRKVEEQVSGKKTLSQNCPIATNIHVMGREKSRNWFPAKS